MTDEPWKILATLPVEENQPTWLSQLLSRNANTAYLRDFGGPRALQAFRDQVPTCSYDDLVPYLERMRAGEPDVLFAGAPVAYERTGGSSGGAKLIPYSWDGLLDFQACIVPWLARTVDRYAITGRAYFSISPATRQPEYIGSVPIGLSDAGYLGERAGYALAAMTAVPLEVGGISDLTRWREATIEHLKAARDLELISVWSPTFLLRLLEDIPDAKTLWPRLKVISCWASGPARRYADQLGSLLPQAEVQPKGLLSTEAIITVPDVDARPVLVGRGFVEFARGDQLLLEDELSVGAEYEVVVTTASGLYRYRTGDRVRFDGRNASGRSILEFIGRDALTCDLVGEKLTESFVAKCMESIPGFAMLVPDVSNPSYVLVCEQAPTPAQVQSFESRLHANPQYDYARKLGQLAPLRVLVHSSAFALVERVMLANGTRLGDVKPVTLRKDADWLPLFEEKTK
jgi:hypothetical protein